MYYYHRANCSFFFLILFCVRLWIDVDGYVCVYIVIQITIIVFFPHSIDISLFYLIFHLIVYLAQKFRIIVLSALYSNALRARISKWKSQSCNNKHHRHWMSTTKQQSHLHTHTHQQTSTWKSSPKHVGAILDTIAIFKSTSTKKKPKTKMIDELGTMRRSVCQCQSINIRRE